MKIEVSQEELKELMIKLCQLGEEMGEAPDRFAIMLSMCAKHLSDAQGIEVHSERVLQS